MLWGCQDIRVGQQTCLEFPPSARHSARAGQDSGMPSECRELFVPPWPQMPQLRGVSYRPCLYFGAPTMSLMFLPSGLMIIFPVSGQGANPDSQDAADSSGLWLSLPVPCVGALQLTQASRLLRLAKGKVLGTERTVGCSRNLEPGMRWPQTQPHAVLSADILGSVLGGEELMGKVLGPRVSNRGRGMGVGVHGVQAPLPWGHAQSLTHPSANLP